MDGEQKYRVQCGGSRSNYATYCRAAHRDSYRPSDYGRDAGFRVALRLD